MASMQSLDIKGGGWDSGDERAETDQKEPDPQTYSVDPSHTISLRDSGPKGQLLFHMDSVDN